MSNTELFTARRTAVLKDVRTADVGFEKCGERWENEGKEEKRTRKTGHFLSDENDGGGEGARGRGTMRSGTKARRGKSCWDEYALWLMMTMMLSP